MLALSSFVKSRADEWENCRVSKRSKLGFSRSASQFSKPFCSPESSQTAFGQTEAATLKAGVDLCVSAVQEQYVPCGHSIRPPPPLSYSKHPWPVS